MTMHPTNTKPLIFAGDKLGNLGLFDASQTRPEMKQEDADEDNDPDPVITTLKPHTRTISAMRTHTSTPQTLYTASYDSSIRALDLEKSISTELYAPAETTDDEPLSGIDMAANDPNVLYFTTLNGVLGRHDTRTPHSAYARLGGAGKDDLFQLSEKKIGGFSLHPLTPHYVATASLDRFMRLWDLRMIKKKMPEMVGEHQSKLSVSHAAFNAAGQVATSSYDDSVKIYDFQGMDKWKQGEKIFGEGEMKPSTVVRHNCQTGRWVTM
jgi:WD repeat-containing protein 76